MKFLVFIPLLTPRYSKVSHLLRFLLFIYSFILISFINPLLTWALVVGTSVLICLLLFFVFTYHISNINFPTQPNTEFHLIIIQTLHGVLFSLFLYPTKQTASSQSHENPMNKRI